MLLALLLAFAGAPDASELHSAVERGDLPAVQKAIEAGVDPDALSGSAEHAVTPLLTAARRGKTAVARYLIEKGAAVNYAEPSFGHTPLHEAVTAGFDDTVDVLLKAGADATAKDRSGDTAFTMALYAGNRELAGRLATKDQLDAAAPSSGITPLLAAASMGDTDGIRWLVAKGAKIDKITQLEYGGSTALTSACSVGQVDSVRTLLELGANPSLKMKDGGTALSHAQASGNAEAVALIQSALAKPRPGATKKTTPTP